MNIGKVFFIGAGPGDPDLITLKGKSLIESADVIIYAGSLVNPALFETIKTGASIYDSASMTLQEITGIMLKAVRGGKNVVRVHTGDPAIYGAILEQMAILRANDIPYEIIPGVSSAFAAAARLGVELTVPEVTQTVIFSRAEGRTPMPPREKLAFLAEHRATLVLFLSISMIDKVVDELFTGGYPPDTPVAVVYKVSWPDELIIRGTLADIARKIDDARIKRQALILIGEALNPNISASEPFHRSKLYDKDFSHSFRHPTKGGDKDEENEEGCDCIPQGVQGQWDRSVPLHPVGQEEQIGLCRACWSTHGAKPAPRSEASRLAEGDACVLQPHATVESEI